MSSFGGASIEATGAIPCENQGFVHRLQEAVLDNIGFENAAPHMWEKPFHLSSFLNCKWPVGAIILFAGTYQA